LKALKGGVTDIAQAKELCKKIGFPVLIKASGGGGGKGMKIVYKEEEFETLFSTAKSEGTKILW
jgi:acetyl-CoA carboxylase biotin carboxylase subunit